MKTIATLHSESGQCIAIVSGPDKFDQQIKVKGRVWRFDYCRHMGPMWLKANGTDRKCQNPNKLVWRAFDRWLKKQK